MNGDSVTTVIPYSPDHTPREMLEEAKARVRAQTVESDILVVCDKRQKGPSWARNRGLEEADTRYVAFLDADDLWHIDKLQRQLEQMKDTGCALCVEGASKSKEQFLRDLFLGDVGGLTSSIVVDTKKIDTRFEETLERREDHLYMMEAANEGGVCFCEDIVDIRRHEEGLSKNTPQLFLLEEHEKFATFVRKRIPDAEEWVPAFYRKYYYELGRELYFRGQYKASIYNYLKSIKSKISFAAVLRILMSAARFLANRGDKSHNSDNIYRSDLLRKVRFVVHLARDEGVSTAIRSVVSYFTGHTDTR